MKTEYQLENRTQQLIQGYKELYNITEKPYEKIKILQKHNIHTTNKKKE